MRLLFVTSTRIGDAVLSSGLLDHLITRHPNLRVTVAAGRVAAPLFEGVPGLERLIEIEKRRYGLHWLELWRAVAAKRWDIVVDLRASALAYLLRAGRRYVMRPSRAPRHRMHDLADMLGLDHPPAPKLWPRPRDEAAVARLVGDDPRPILAVGPTANWGGKQWPADRFRDLVRRLTASGAPLAGARVAVFGAPHERAAAEALLSAVRAEDLIDLVGTEHLLTSYAMLTRAALYIGNDSGLMHMAAAAGAPTLGLFGPSPDVHYAPWGDLTAVVRTPESYEALMARRAEVPDGACLMESLSVDAVEAAARALLARARAAGRRSS